MFRLISILLTIFLCVGDIFLFRVGFLPFEPSLSLIPLFIICSLLFNTKTVHGLFKTTNARFFFGILILGCTFSLFSISLKIGYAIANHIITFAIYILSYLFFTNRKAGKPKYIFLFAYLILSLSVVYGLIFSGSGDTRGAGFAENPNNAAMRLVVLYIVVSTFLDKKTHFAGLLILTFIVVFLTLSRSGVLLFVIVSLVLVPLKFSRAIKVIDLPGRIVRLMPLFLLLVFSIILTMPHIVRIVPAFEQRAAAQRVNQILNQEEFVSEHDTEEGGRIEIFNSYLNMFIENPLGYGTGMSMGDDLYYKATHNMFLRFMIDYGIIGLLFFSWMILYGFRRSLKHDYLYGIAFYLLFFISCFFTNTLLENRTFIIGLAFLDAHIKYRYNDKVTV